VLSGCVACRRTRRCDYAEVECDPLLASRGGAGSLPVSGWVGSKSLLCRPAGSHLLASPSFIASGTWPGLAVLVTVAAVLLRAVLHCHALVHGSLDMRQTLFGWHALVILKWRHPPRHA